MDTKQTVELLATEHFTKLTDWEKDFIQSMRQKQSFSPNMKLRIDEMHAKYVLGQDTRTQRSNEQKQEDLSAIERGRFFINKTVGGWQIHVDKIPVGGPVDRPTAIKIVMWLEDCIDSLAEFGKPGINAEEAPF